MKKASPAAKEALEFAGFAASLFLLWYIGKRFAVSSGSLKAFLNNVPLALSGAVFVLLYVLVTFFVWLSKDVFRIAAAVVYGPWVSTLLVFIGEMANAWVLFNFSRRAGKGFVQKNVPARFTSLYGKSGGIGFGWLLFLRATPLFPFRFLDLGAGLSELSFGRYFAACALGSPLRIFWLQYILAGVGQAALTDPAKITAYLQEHNPVLWLSFLYFVFLVIASLIMKAREKRCR